MLIAAFIYNSQYSEAAQVSISGWVDRWYIYTSHKREGNPTICNSMYGPGKYYAKWNKSLKEKEVPYNFTYMWNLMNKIN